jgi:hypothetical protein
VVGSSLLRSGAVAAVAAVHFRSSIVALCSSFFYALSSRRANASLTRCPDQREPFFLRFAGFGWSRLAALGHALNSSLSTGEILESPSRLKSCLCSCEKPYSGNGGDSHFLAHESAPTAQAGRKHKRPPFLAADEPKTGWLFGTV